MRASDNPEATLQTTLATTVAPPGSTLYHAVCRLPQPSRTACLGLFGLHRELQDLVFSKSDTVYVQLGWWHEEIGRLLSGHPRHPVTRAIATWPECSRARPTDWVTSLEPLIGRTRFDDESDLLDFCKALSAPSFKAVSRAIGDHAGEADAYATDAAIAFTLFGFVQNLGRYLRDDIVPIPGSDLERAGMNAAGLLQSPPTPSHLELMALQYTRIWALWSKASITLPTGRMPQQHPALIIGAIQCATLDEIKRSDYDVIHQYIDITPIRKTWIAWTTYHKAKRGIHA